MTRDNITRPDAHAEVRRFKDEAAPPATGGTQGTPRTDAKVAEMIALNQSPDGLEFFARQLERELAEARAENTRLRAALATSKDPCIYCQLSAADMGKCKAGFPGCARADDLSGCPEFGASLDAATLRTQLAAVTRERDEAQRLRGGDNELIRALAADAGIKITAPNLYLGMQWEQFHDGVMQLASVRKDAERLREAVETALYMHLGRCASSEPFSAQDYRQHAIAARDILRAALRPHATPGDNATNPSPGN